MDTPLLTLCCVCQIVIRDGQPDAQGRVSHGMCQPCAASWLAEWKARKAVMA